MSYDSTFRPNLFGGQTIIVTGGGSGIGRCAAHELATLGAHVMLVERKTKKLGKITGEIVKDDDGISWHACDIHEGEAVKTLMANILTEHGAIHRLVSNVGGQYPSPLASISQKGFETVLRTSPVSGFLVAHEVLSQSMSKTDDSIVNMLADIWGGMPDMGHSGATRSGMENFTRTAAVEWGHADVQVSAMVPGWITSSGIDTYEGAFEAVIPTLRKHAPLKRVDSESEIATTIVFLLSPGAAFVNGNTIRTDGAASQGGHTFPLLKGKLGQSHAYNGFRRIYLPDVLKDQED